MLQLLLVVLAEQLVTRYAHYSVNFPCMQANCNAVKVYCYYGLYNCAGLIGFIIKLAGRSRLEIESP